MEIRVFFGEQPQYGHEYDQLMEVIRLMERSDLEGPIFLFHTFLLANSEIDCLVLCRHGMVLLDLKAYRGVIRGEEEGSWTVTTPAGELVTMQKNLFQQLRVHRNDLFNKLKRIRGTDLPWIEEEDLRKIDAWGYFLPGSVYPDGQIDRAVVKWFSVVTAETLVDRLRHVNAGYTLRTDDMEVIARALRLRPTEDGSISSPASPAVSDRLSGDELLRRMNLLVERMEAIPGALTRRNGSEPACTPPTPAFPLAGGCSDLVPPDESEGPVATMIREFICREFVAPARAAGHTTFSVTSGEVHTLMGLHEDMAVVCGVLRGHRLEEVCQVELLEEVRRVRVRTNSASNRFIFRVLGRGRSTLEMSEEK